MNGTIPNAVGSELQYIYMYKLVCVITPFSYLLDMNVVIVEPVVATRMALNE